MKEAQRFTVNWSPEGTWVKHTDNGPCVYYEDYKKEITALQVEKDARGKLIEEMADTIDWHQKKLTEALKEREALKTQLSGRTYCHSDEAVEAENELYREALGLAVDALQDISVGELINQHYKIMAKRKLNFITKLMREALKEAGE